MQVMYKISLALAGLVISGLSAYADLPPAKNCPNNNQNYSVCYQVAFVNGTNQSGQKEMGAQNVIGATQTVIPSASGTWYHALPTCNASEGGVTVNSYIAYRFGNLGTCMVRLDMMCKFKREQGKDVWGWVNQNMDLITNCTTNNLVIFPQGQPGNYVIQNWGRE